MRCKKFFPSFLFHSLWMIEINTFGWKSEYWVGGAYVYPLDIGLAGLQWNLSQCFCFFCIHFWGSKGWPRCCHWCRDLEGLVLVSLKLWEPLSHRKRCSTGLVIRPGKDLGENYFATMPHRMLVISSCLCVNPSTYVENVREHERMTSKLSVPTSHPNSISPLGVSLVNFIFLWLS